MKKYLGEMKCLVDGGEMNFDGYLDKMLYLVNEGKFVFDILSKMWDVVLKLIDFVKLFDLNLKEKIKKYIDIFKLIYDLFGVKLEK